MKRHTEHNGDTLREASGRIPRGYKARVKGFACLSMVFLCGSAVAHERHAGPKPNSLANFEFKGVVAGDSVDLSTIGTCEPPSMNGEVSCTPTNATVANVSGYAAPSLMFYNNKLTMMLFMFPRMGYSKVEDAFRQKYGKPCEIEHSKWHLQSGEEYVSTKTTWCFRTGRLYLDEFTTNDEDSMAMYRDELSQPPTKPAKADF